MIWRSRPLHIFRRISHRLFDNHRLPAMLGPLTNSHIPWRVMDVTMRNALIAFLAFCSCALPFVPAAEINNSDHPIPPAEAAGRMTLPEGFKATLFAGEPDLVQPIAFTFDDRGRLWVVESLTYPHWLAPGTTEGKDRIVIFDDPDGAGHFRTRKVFYDQGVNLSGITSGFGGVWLCSIPNLVFIPIREGEDQPGGPATGDAGRVEHADQAQRHQSPRLGARWLALWVQRHSI